MPFLPKIEGRDYRLKASLSWTMFSCRSMRSIFTSRMVVFLTISSSSDSLNFLMATIGCLRREDTELARLLVPGLVHHAVRPFSHYADHFVLVHSLFKLNFY